MENIFIDIQNRLTSAVPEIQWIDIDEGQFDAFGENAPVDYPCVLVGFPSADFSNAGRRTQTAEVNITVKVAFKLWESFSTKVPNRAVTFEHFAILKKVMTALHAMGGENYNGLVRVRFEKNTSVDPKLYEITYRCQMRDFDTIKDYAHELIENLEIIKN